MSALRFSALLCGVVVLSVLLVPFVVVRWCVVGAVWLLVRAVQIVSLLGVLAALTVLAVFAWPGVAAVLLR